MTFLENFRSCLHGPHKHCYGGALAVGATFLASSFLGDTTELILAITTLGAVAVYTLQENPQVEAPTTD